MKLLFITPQLPYPPRQGTTIRNYNLIKCLAENHTVDLLSFSAPGDHVANASPLLELCRRVECIPQPLRTTGQRIKDTFLSRLPDMGHRLESEAMRVLILDWIANAAPGEWDIVQVEGIEVAQYGLQIIKSMAKRFPQNQDQLPKLVFDNHNCEYLLQKRNALNDLRIPKRWAAGVYSVLQWQKLERYERSICRSADATLAVSVADRDAMLALAPESDITVVFNGFDPPVAQPPVTNPKNRFAKILFIGKMDYRPNVDAMLWFGEEIFPSIRSHMPDVVLEIVGSNPHPRLDGLREYPGIEVVGMVADLNPYLNEAAVYVIPLRVGGGTRFKALEAMAYAKPIVSTSLGIEGIPVSDGEELLIADTPESFSTAVLMLLQDLDEEGTLSRSLGDSAFHLVTSTFTWASIMPTVEDVYARL